MYKVCVCGHFGGDNNFNDGQTVKTKNIHKALVKKYGSENILVVDTYNWKKHPISFLNECKNGLKDSENLIMLPAHNGVKVFIPLFTCLNKKYKRKIFYAVVGGWLPELVKDKKWLLNSAKKLTKVFVETNKMKNSLNELGLDNVEILLNFKDITPLKEEELNYSYEKPYKLCTFSRVMQEKGIEDAIDVIKKINEEEKETIYSLDIYGPIDTEYSERFRELEKSFPDYIKYKGCVDSDKSVEVLKEYYLLLFPTRFKTEGIPGTVIDALATGLPVVASKWDNYADVLVDKYNSFLFSLGDIDEFEKILYSLKDIEKVASLKKNALETAKAFDKKEAVKILLDSIEK